MAGQKTLPTDVNVSEYLNKIEDERKRADAFELVEIMKELTGEPPVMWGSSIIGFGSIHYVYESGREGDSPLAAFAARKTSHVVYLCDDFPERQQLLDQLGKHKSSKGCIYFKKISDIDVEVLKKLIKIGIEVDLAKYG